MVDKIYYLLSFVENADVLRSEYMYDTIQPLQSRDSYLEFVQHPEEVSNFPRYVG